MYKKKFFLIVFEGIEGSGKSFQAKKLFNSIKKRGIKALLTREPGGIKSAEIIRNVILKDYFRGNKKNEFDKYTDTLLYLAARNEHIQKKIYPAFKKKKILICDRFIDSTIAYQVHGKGVSKSFIDNIHKYILKGIKPDLTFVLKVNILKALQRLKKRKKMNRYDNFSKDFYIKAQKAFLKIAKRNKNKYYVFDNSRDDNKIENNILDKVLHKINYR